MPHQLLPEVVEFTHAPPVRPTIRGLRQGLLLAVALQRLVTPMRLCRYPRHPGRGRGPTSPTWRRSCSPNLVYHRVGPGRVFAFCLALRRRPRAALLNLIVRRARVWQSLAISDSLAWLRRPLEPGPAPPRVLRRQWAAPAQAGRQYGRQIRGTGQAPAPAREGLWNAWRDPVESPQPNPHLGRDVAAPRSAPARAAPQFWRRPHPRGGGARNRLIPRRTGRVIFTFHKEVILEGRRRGPEPCGFGQEPRPN